jgi:hypothetical protein
MSRRAVGVLLLVLLCACGGQGDSTTPDGGPAASIDRKADGRITGPVNQARDAAEEAERRQRELQQAND